MLALLYHTLIIFSKLRNDSVNISLENNRLLKIRVSKDVINLMVTEPLCPVFSQFIDL